MTEVVSPEDWKAAQEGARRACATLAELRPVFDKLAAQIRHVSEAIDQHLWGEYRRAGQIYGPNYRGRDRWLVERAEQARAEEALAEAQGWIVALEPFAQRARERRVP